MNPLRHLACLVTVRGRLSLGRVAFWVVLATALCHYPSLPSEWLTILMSLLAYNLGSKITKEPPLDK